MEKPQFINGEIYHLYNRGVEKRNIFMDKGDYFRFINCLSEFNDVNPALPSNLRYLRRNPSQATYQDMEKCLDVVNPNTEPLVEILAFCLMPNHYHLLIRQVEECGIIKFMRKLGSGYANYFNQKNSRVGSLFQGRFKAIHVDQDDYFKYLTLYIHLNPLDLILPKWREGNINNPEIALDYLAAYRWSSYLDYTGKNNFPVVLKKDFLLDVFGGADDMKQYTKDFITSMNLGISQDLLLE